MNLCIIFQQIRRSFDLALLFGSFFGSYCPALSAISVCHSNKQSSRQLAANRTERERDEQQSYREGGGRGMSRPAEGAAGDGGAGLQKGRRFPLSPARCLPPDVLPPPSVFRSISPSLPLDSPSLPLDFPSLPLDSLFPSQVCANFIYFPPIPSQKSR
jgi:hypothetical protein